MRKNHLILSIGVFLLLTLAFGCKQNPPSERIQTYTEFKSLFADPPSDYRTAPLWDWNDKISEAGIDFHMKKFKEGGLGGVFIHPRPGLITEYISRKIGIISSIIPSERGKNWE